MTVDVIRAVESCYACAEPDEAWLGGVLDALTPLDRGRLGVVAELFRFTPEGERVTDAVASTAGLPPGALEARDRIFPPQMLAPGEPVVLAMRRAARVGVAREVAAFFASYGAVDAVGIFTQEPGGRTVLVSTPILPGHPIPPRILHRLRLFAAHLGAAARLRRAACAPDGRRVEAVLDPAGKVVDATGPGEAAETRRTLAEAVRRMDRARGALRRTDPDEALRLWQGLVDGTWSLVDRCDADGRRYVLARRNEPGVHDPKALTARERFVVAFAAMGHQDKFIAYLLGLSASAVAAHLRSAQRKLAVSCRAELVRTFAPLVLACASVAT